MTQKQATLNDIYKEVEFIKERVLEIEEHMVDIDSIMTEDDYAALAKYRAEKAKGELISHQALKKELGL